VVAGAIKARWSRWGGSGRGRCEAARGCRRALNAALVEGRGNSAGVGRRAPVRCGHGGGWGARVRRRREVGDAPDVWAPSVGERVKERRGSWAGRCLGR
jgi:hypothetical protein